MTFDTEFIISNTNLEAHERRLAGFGAIVRGRHPLDCCRYVWECSEVSHLMADQRLGRGAAATI